MKTIFLLVTITYGTTGLPQVDVYERDSKALCERQAANYNAAGICAVCVPKPKQEALTQ